MTSAKLILAAVFTISLSFSGQVNAQQEVKVNIVSLTDNISMLSAKGGNVGVLVGQDGTFVIDDQFAPLSEKLMAAIKQIGGDTPRFLINTHYHGDHTGGNENFANAGAMIVSHDNVRKRLQSGYTLKAFNKTAPPASAKALPVVTYSKNMHFHINQEEISLVFVPNAHTDGDSFVHFVNANIIHAGDTFFNGFYPFIDAEHGGSLQGMITAADKILALSNAQTKIIPGHGKLANQAELQAYRGMLATALGVLKKLKDQGLSLDEAILKQPLQALDAQWGGKMFSSDRWIKLVYATIN